MKRILRPMVLSLAIATHVLVAPAHATGFPVFDAGNFSQNIITALKAIAQTAKQIEQYRTQLQQYQNMLQNTMAPATEIWDAAQRTMDDLRASMDTLTYYKNALGNLDGYLDRFRDEESYRRSPCLSGGTCRSEDWIALGDAQRLGSEAQKKSNDALLRTIDKQQDALQADARQLERLQSAAQGASGQLQAIGYANQLASQQANQLLQIRALLLAQQNAMAVRSQVMADREALSRASDRQVLETHVQTSSARSW